MYYLANSMMNYFVILSLKNKRYISQYSYIKSGLCGNNSYCVGGVGAAGTGDPGLPVDCPAMTRAANLACVSQ